MTARTKAIKGKQTRPNKKKVEIGSGNVFADLGFEDSEERLLKAKLATKIAQLIEKKGWTQTQTAERTAWINRKFHDLCAAGSPAFQRIVCSRS